MSANSSRTARQIPRKREPRFSEGGPSFLSGDDVWLYLPFKEFYDQHTLPFQKSLKTLEHKSYHQEAYLSSYQGDSLKIIFTTIPPHQAAQQLRPL